VQRRKAQIGVAHRNVDFTFEVLGPPSEQNNRLVLISHGHCDDVGSFLGWGKRLAAHGYVVLVRYHPGSDREQQASMLSGTLPPPVPEELALRAKDLSALLDAASEQRLPIASELYTDRVVVIGHSWGWNHSPVAGWHHTERRMPAQKLRQL
jgi:predicted dienelactone hydrolase